MHNNSALKFNDDTIFQLVKRMNIDLREHRKPIWSQFFRYYEERRPKLSEERKIGAIVALIYVIDDIYLGEEGILQFIIDMVKELNLATPAKILYNDNLRAHEDMGKWSETLPKYTVVLGKRKHEFEMIYDLHGGTVRGELGVVYSYNLDFYQGKTLCHIAKPGETYVAKKTKPKSTKMFKKTKRVGGVKYASLIN